MKRGQGGAKRAENGGPKYEGLPPEVGAFNSKKWPHAPWPVHNFGPFSRFFDDFRTLGVGVIPWVLVGVDGMGGGGPWHKRW